MKYDCPILKKKGKLPIRREQQNNKMSANVLKGYESVKVLMVSDLDIKDEWIMDLGCTFHMSPNKQFLVELEEFETTNSVIL